MTDCSRYQHPTNQANCLANKPYGQVSHEDIRLSMGQKILSSIPIPIVNLAIQEYYDRWRKSESGRLAQADRLVKSHTVPAIVLKTTKGYTPIAVELQQEAFVPKKFIPAKPLVGIELNPGPLKKTIKISNVPVKSKNKNKNKNNNNNMNANGRIPPLQRVVNDFPRIKEFVAAPAAFGSVKRSRMTFRSHSNGSGLILDYHGLYRNVYCYSNTLSFTTGSVDQSAALNPSYFVNQVIANFAAIFSRYKFENVTLHWRPLLSSAVTGECVLGYIQDGYADSVTNPPITDIESFVNSSSSSIWTPQDLSVVLPVDKQWYYTFASGSANGAEYRLDNQGTALIDGSITTTNDSLLGDLWISCSLHLADMGYNYNIKLYKIPKINGHVPVNFQVNRQRLAAFKELEKEHEEKYPPPSIREMTVLRTDPLISDDGNRAFTPMVIIPENPITKPSTVSYLGSLVGR